MRSLLAPNRRAVLVMIKDDSRSALEYIIQQLWTFVGQNARGSWRRNTRAGGDYVFEKKFSCVFGTAADDPTLRVTRVRFVRIAGAGDDGDLTVAVAG